jgi:hypothetical protein
MLERMGVAGLVIPLTVTVMVVVLEIVVSAVKLRVRALVEFREQEGELVVPVDRATVQVGETGRIMSVEKYSLSAGEDPRGCAVRSEKV